jgi:hypothetical protein
LTDWHFCAQQPAISDDDTRAKTAPPRPDAEQLTNEDAESNTAAFGQVINSAPPSVALLELIRIEFENVKFVVVAGTVIGESRNA